MTRDRRSERSWLIAMLVIAAAYWAADLLYFRHGVPALLDDTWEYAVAARHLLAGDGFVTSVIHPPLWGLRDEALRVPLLIHGPLMPVLFAPFMALLGDGIVIRAAGLAAGLAMIAAWLTYRMATRWFGSRVGVAAALLFTVSPFTLDAVHHDIALIAGACLLLVAIDANAPPPADGPSPPGPAGAGGGPALASGLALGLGYLARPEFLLAAPIFAIAAGRRALPLLAGFVFAAGPWWWHQWQATGMPFFNLSSYLLIGYWGAHPDLSVLRDFHLAPAAWPDALREAWPALGEKWAYFFPRAAKRILQAPTPGTSAFALIGLGIAVSGRTLLAMPDEDRARAIRRLGLLCAALSLIPLTVMTMTVYDERYATPFLPLWSVAAAFAVAWIVRRLPRFIHRARVWITVLALIVLPSVARGWFDAARQRPTLVRELADTRAWIRALKLDAIPAGTPLFSATPDFAAWYAKRPVIWLTREAFEQLPACGDGASTAATPCRHPGSALYPRR